MKSQKEKIVSSVQKVEGSLEGPVPLFLPVRTKKRYFIPPAVALKGKQENTEAKARAAGIVFRQQYLERPINISCTGNQLLLNTILRFLH